MKNVDKKAVGSRIKQIRMNKGYTLETFGKLFNVSKSSVLKWEQGQSLPNKERLASISKIADMTVNELLYGFNFNLYDEVEKLSKKEKLLLKNGINKKEVGERIQKIRFSKALTLEQFGNLFNAGKSNVQTWENGNCLPNKKRQLKIAELGKISVNELLYGNIEKDIEAIKTGLLNLPTKERIKLISEVLGVSE